MSKILASNALNAREVATLVWLAIGAAWVLWARDRRSMIVSLLRTAAHPVLLIPFLLLIGWVSVVIVAAARVALWSDDLLKETVEWTLGSAPVLYMSITNVARDPRFFRNMAARTVRTSAFIEFYVNLVTFNLIVELVLLPVVTFLAMLAVVAGSDQKYRPVKRVLDFVLGIGGLLLIGLVTSAQLHEWQHANHLHDLRLLLLPIWLTVGVLPFMYVLSLYVNYQSAFSRIDWATRDDSRARWRAKLAMVTTLTIRTHAVAAFGAPLLFQVTSAPSLRAARMAIKAARKPRAQTP